MGEGSRGGLHVRPLDLPEELAEVVRLQELVWGLSPREAMSPITLGALSQKRPRTGWVWGGFLDGRMVAFAVLMATREPDLAYGHMFGVLPELRDAGLGQEFLGRALDLLTGQGIARLCWTFEPLESRNAHLYLNRLGGRATGYHRAHFHLESGAGRGLPLDRFLCELALDQWGEGGLGVETLAEALAAYPLAESGRLPAAESLLVEIPHDLQALLASDPAAAARFRAETRAVLEGCLNARGMVVDRLYAGLLDGQPRSFLRVRRP